MGEGLKYYTEKINHVAEGHIPMAIDQMVKMVVLSPSIGGEYGRLPQEFLFN